MSLAYNFLPGMSRKNKKSKSRRLQLSWSRLEERIRVVVGETRDPPGSRLNQCFGPISLSPPVKGKVLSVGSGVFEAARFRECYIMQLYLRQEP